MPVRSAEAVWEGDLKQGKGSIKLDSGVEVHAPTNGLSAGSRCHAVVRPEKLRIEHASGASGDGMPSVDGVVESSVYLGTSTQIVVRLPDEVALTVLVPNASVAERGRLPGGGAAVQLSWSPEHIHIVRESAATASADANGAPRQETLTQTATA